MQNNGSSANQPWSTPNEDRSWRDSVENATRWLDPSVYSDRNGYPRYSSDGTVPNPRAAGPDRSGFQQGLQATYGMPSVPHAHATYPSGHAHGLPSSYAQYTGAAPTDPYPPQPSYSTPGHGPTIHGGVAPAHYPQPLQPSPGSSTQGASVAAMGYAPFPASSVPVPHVGNGSHLTAPTRLDHTTQPLTVDGKPRERVFIACSYCRRRKFRCDGTRPCTNCQRYGEECTYDPFPIRRGPDAKQRIRSPAGMRKSRGSRSGGKDDSDYYDEDGAGPSGNY